MIQSFLSRDSISVLVRQHLRDEVLAFMGSCVPYVLFKVEFSFHYLCHYFLVGLTVEWGFSAKEDEHDHSQTPQITLRSIVSSQNFWRDVVNCTESFCQLLRGVKDLAGSEVYNFDWQVVRLLFFKQDVLWLEISVNNIMLVAVVDCRKHLLHYLCSIILRESLPSNDLIKKFASSAEFLDQVVLQVILIDFIESHYIGMI